MADTYGLQGDGYGVQGEGGTLALQPAADGAKGVREEFARLVAVEAEALRRTRELERAEKDRAAGLLKDAEAVRASAEAWRTLRESVAGVKGGITSVGNILTDILGGRLVQAISGAASAVSAFLLRGPSGPADRPPAQGQQAGRGGRQAGGQPVPDPGPPRGPGMPAPQGPGMLAQLGAVTGVAGAALTALAGAARQAYSTMIGFAQSASPGAVSALNSAFELLSARIGSAFLPLIPKIGAGILMLADEIGSLIKAMGLAGSGAGTFTERADAAADKMMNLTSAIIPLIGLFRALADAGAKLLLRLTTGKSEREVNEGLRKAGIDPDNLSGSVLRNLGLYQSVGGPELSGKKRELDTRSARYEMDFITSALMKSGGAPRFEQGEEAYRRITQATAGVTPIEQKLLNEQMANRQALEAIHGLLSRWISSNPRATTDGPSGT